MDDELDLDLVTLWQSELTAMAADRELRESFVAMVGLWAAAATALAKHDPAGGAWPTQPPRAAAAAAAPDAGLDARNEQLSRRITALERRLGELERGGS